MKIIGLIVALSLLPLTVFAKNLYWDANTEDDMAQYHVYVCKAKGCIATDNGALWLGTVKHIKPNGPATYTIPLPDGIEGAAVVTAQDESGNTSPPSAMLSFTTVANLPPLAPTGLTVR